MFPKKNKFVELKGLSAFHLFKAIHLTGFKTIDLKYIQGVCHNHMRVRLIPHVIFAMWTAKT